MPHSSIKALLLEGAKTTQDALAGKMNTQMPNILPLSCLTIMMVSFHMHWPFFLFLA